MTSLKNHEDIYIHIKKSTLKNICVMGIFRPFQLFVYAVITYIGMITLSHLDEIAVNSWQNMVSILFGSLVLMFGGIILFAVRLGTLDEDV